MMNKPVFLLYGLLIAALVAVPVLVDGSYYQYLGIIVFIYAIVAIGLNILAGYAGLFSLGHAALMAIGAYGTALLSIWLSKFPMLAAVGAHVWIGIVAATAAAALFGAFLALPALRVKGPYLAMVTIAFGWVIYKVLQEWVPVTGGDLGISSIPKLQLGPHRLETAEFYYVALLILVAAILAQHRLVTSQYGMRIRAMKHSEIAVASVGVDVYRLKVIVFVISAFFAGLGGALFAHQQNYISPDNFQFFSSVFLLLAVLFGGAGTQLGPLIGAATLTLLPEMLHEFEKYRLIVYGTFILITLYFLPGGFAGLLRLPRPSPITRGNDTVPPGSGEDVELEHLDGGASLDIANVSRAFGGVQALHDVTFSVEAGSIHALIGPNGAGKTTLINVVTGFYRPDGGHIVVGGIRRDLPSLDAAARQGIARTFQTIKLFGDMTVLEHVLVGFARSSRSGIWATLAGTRRSRAEARDNIAAAKNLIRFVGLGAYEDTPANTLPYGHRRLVEIARALAVRPRLLLLDEPAAGLVAGEIEALAGVIRKLKSLGMTILLVEHHMDLVVSVSDRITVLDYGEVLAEGPPDAIQRDPKVIAAYLGGLNVAA